MNICLDIGGTFIKWGVFAENADTLSASGKEPTQKADVLAHVLGLIDRLMCEFPNCVHIGISTAGQVNPSDGSILFATDNLPNWTGVKLKEIVEARFKLPCIVENDVDAVALGEFRNGAARGFHDFICVAFGTGIGGAIFSNGKLLRARGSAGEFGHITIERNGRACNCGNFGCYEQYASAGALFRDACAELGDIFPKTGVEWLFENEGRDERVSKLVNRYVDDVVTGLMGLVHALNPQAVVLGGAVSENEKMVSLVRAALLTRVMPSFAHELKVVRAQLGNNAALYGVLGGGFLSLYTNANTSATVL